MTYNRKRPGKHTRNVPTKHGRRNVLVNPMIKRKRSTTTTIGGITQSEANKIYKLKLEEANKQLRTKGRVRLPELGILRIKIKPARKARPGINPFTQEKIMIKAKPRTKVVKFRASKALKEALN